MALTVATGFVMDDAVVVVENTMRHLEDGLRPVAAALRGDAEVGFTVISMSLSLIAVFMPILLMAGLVGRLFQQFAVTWAIAIMVSLVVSLTTTPMLCALLLRREVSTKRPNWFIRQMENGFNAALAGYTKSLRWALRHARLVGFGLAVTVVLNVVLFVVVPKGFFPSRIRD